MKKLVAIIFVLILSVPLYADSDLPDNRGPVTDLAGILNPGEIRKLTGKVTDYRNQTGNEIGVLIVPDLGNNSIENYAHDVLNKWGIGQKNNDNGVLFLVAIKERKARIEVGYGLEAQLTDLESGRIVNRKSPMADYFRKGNYYGGIGAVIDGIIQAIGGEYDPPKKKTDTGKRFGSIFIILFNLLFIIVPLIIRANRASINSRRKGIRKSDDDDHGGFWFGGFGGFGGGGSSGGGGGVFSFGGGSSGGGGASGGW